MRSRTLPRAILVGGAIGGALDLLFAVTLAGVYGVGPGRVFQTIASGLLGQAAFDGGAGVQALGVACHFALSWIWAVLFALAAMRLPMLVRRPVMSGIAFGIVVFACMRLLVLPLSAYPHPVSFKPLSSALDLASHMLLFGVPIALCAAKALRANGAGARVRAQDIAS